MDMNLSAVEEIICNASKALSEDGMSITLVQLRSVLNDSKELTLTPM